MKKQGRMVPRRGLVGKAALGLGLSACAMSVVSAWFVPLGGLWLSLAWASVGCVACLWTGMVLADATASIGDFIVRVESGPPGTARVQAEPVQRGANS